MLLPAALDLLHVRRVVVPPHPGNFSALGLLSTDLVYYDSRSAYVLLLPGAAAQIDGGVRGDGARPARARRAGTARSGAASTGASSARAGRRRSSRCRTGRSRTIAGLVERFHDDVRAPLRQPLPDDPGAGRQLPRRADVPVGEGRVRAAPRTSGDAPAGSHRRAPPLRRRAAPGGWSTTGRPAGRCADRRPGGDPRGAFDHVRRPRADRRGRPPRRAAGSRAA